jgi:hypothetical protein
LCSQIAQFGVLCFPEQDASAGKGRWRIRLQEGTVCETVVLIQVPVEEDEQEQAGVLLWL